MTDKPDQIERAGLPDVVRDRSGRKRDRLKALARRATDRARDVRDSPVGQWIESRAKDAAEFALRPESIENVQSAMVFVANFGLDRARSADDNADLLLDLLDWLEQKHGREVVARTFAHNTPVLRPRWMKLVQSVATPGKQAATARDLAAVRDDAARLLGELAGLEHPEPPPRKASKIVSYFDSEWIPERFLPLARCVAGERPPSKAGANPTAGQTMGGSIARFIPSLEDPTVSFLLSSLLVVSNAYMTRELLERLPDLAELIRNET